VCCIAITLTSRGRGRVSWLALDGLIEFVLSVTTSLDALGSDTRTRGLRQPRVNDRPITYSGASAFATTVEHRPGVSNTREYLGGPTPRQPTED